MAEVKTEIRNIVKNQEASKIENTQAHDEIKLMIKNFIDSADNKYASKKIETAFWWFLASVGLILIGALAATILK